MHHTIRLALGALEPPTEFRLFAAGPIETTKGVFLFDDKAAALVMAAAEDWGNDYPLDYDHFMTDPMPIDPAQAKKAAGWFGLALRAGELWAVDVRWTPAAAQALRDGEWKYVSPTFSTDESGRVTELVNCALTNLPATKNQQPLTAASKRMTPMTKAELAAKLAEKMSADEMTALLAKLDEDTDAAKQKCDDDAETKKSAKADDDGDADTSKLDADLDEEAKKTAKGPDSDAPPPPAATTKTGRASLGALVRQVTGTDDPEEQKGALIALGRTHKQVQELSAQVAAEKQQRVADERAGMLKEAVRLGKVTPAEARDDALIRSLSNAQLKGYIARLPAKVKTVGGGADPANAEGAASTSLSKNEREMIEQVGVSEEAYLKRRTFQLNRLAAARGE